MLGESGRLALANSGEVLRLSNLRSDDAGNYTCRVTNHFGSDQITYHLDVRRKTKAFFFLPKNVPKLPPVSRNNGVPPAPPTFAVTGSTPSSISLTWAAATAADGGSPILAYNLYFRWGSHCKCLIF